MPVKSPVDIDDPTLSLTVKSNGSPIKDYYPVISVKVIHEINRISFAEIILIDGTVEADDFPISDSEDFIPGNEVEILAGYGSDDAKSIFKGVVVKQAVQIRAAGGFNLVVTCKHKAVLMTYNRMEAEFQDKTDSDIISSISGKYGLSCTVDSTSSQQKVIFQKLSTDWDFILSRAEFNGFITTLEDEKMSVGKPKFDGAAALRVAFGESIISFNAELNAEKQAPSLAASAWDIKNKKLLSSDATEPAVNEQGDLNAKSLSGKLSQKKLSLSSITPMEQDDLKTWADGALLMMRLNAIKGQVTFMGNAGVKVGGIIELAGVGKRFNGNAFVSSVAHTLEEGEWTTKVKFGLEHDPIYEKTDFSYPAATGQLPAIRGLQVATVKKIFEDPDSQYRILVDLPSNAENQAGIWARVSNFYATSGAGAFFLPEIGDEVVLGFLESDPRYPVVLGSLYSSGAQPATQAADNNNYIKTLTTKSKLQVSFDDEKKIIIIKTPGNNTITLSDEDKSIEIKDQNSNTVKMSGDGISLQSGKDINIKATGNINIDATGKLTLSAKQDVGVSGMNINNTAQVGFTAKGNASAEISASGQTVVKGGLVMIN